MGRPQSQYTKRPEKNPQQELVAVAVEAVAEEIMVEEEEEEEEEEATLIMDHQEEQEAWPG